MAHAHSNASHHPAILDEVKPGDSASAPTCVDHHRDFAWITDKICGIVEGKTPTWWWVLLRARLLHRLLHRRGHHVSGGDWRRRVGTPQPDQLGLADRQLRVSGSASATPEP